jgi:soluble lytic murein transglycosylase-like protein
MRKLPSLFAFALLSAAAPAFAQQQQPAAAPAAYRFDNFDTREGVRIEQPPAPAAAIRPRRAMRLTARTVAPVEKVTPKPSEETYRPAGETLPAPVMAAGRSLDGFSTGNALVDSLIVESGSRNGVDPVLLYAIMHQESTFKPRALSYKGASGLMQLMPATARRFGVSNIWDPRQNIEGGARYVRWLLNFFDGDVRLALAGYNAGEGAVLKYGRRVPPYSETQNYVRRIFGRYSIMRDPQAVRRAPRLTSQQVADIKAAEKPGVVYEQSVYVVRLPDGKLRLVSQ